MAAKGRKPKVYGAEIDGLNEWIVAAPNRPAALEALGVNQDLFAQGMAWEEKDPAKLKAALAAPGQPLRRAKGSKAAFAPATGAADWSSAEPKGAKRKPKAPDRRPLDRAEAELKRIEDRHKEAVRDIAAERRALDDREAREDQAFEADMHKAKAAAKEAKSAFRDAGGR
jgi:hypothetical protein